MILGIVMAAPADIEVGAVLLPALAAQPAIALALLVALDDPACPLTIPLVHLSLIHI